MLPYCLWVPKSWSVVAIKCFFQKGAGEGSGLPDELYADAGATLVKGPEQVFGEADLIVKVKEPMPEEWSLIRSGQTLFTYFHFAADRALTEAMLATDSTSVAYETLVDSQGRLPLLTPMSEVAGRDEHSRRCQVP